MALLILRPDTSSTRLVRAIEDLDPEVEVRVWPEIGDPKDIELVLCWNPPPGEIAKLPSLKGIQSYGVGVDHILKDPELPSHLPIARIVGPELIQQMVQYLVLVVLKHHRHFETYEQQKKQGVWSVVQPNWEETPKLGILGLGLIGSQVATTFCHLGFKVRGWSRSQKRLPQIECFHGHDHLASFACSLDYLICLLPLTPQTEGVLGQPLFSFLKEGAYVVNVGRGQHVVEKDLLQAVDSGKLSGACLDVFPEEPLAKNHPFWKHPKIAVTPHIACPTDPYAAARQTVVNYRLVQAGKPMNNLIQIERGY